jgi:non-specific serine/threonine protein kinase
VLVTCPNCKFDNTADSKFCKECGRQLSPLEGPRVSKTLTLETSAPGLGRGTVFAGRYEIIEELGTGGMGRVYRAFDKKISEEVALKLIRPEIAAEERTIERFRNEIKIARKIRHPNVCAMFDLGEEEKTLFISMEYIRGEDLKSVLRRMGSLTAGKAVSIARQVAEGLSEAHKLGVIHRDLKPGNIMIDDEGNAKIMDFGIARSLRDAGLSVEDSFVGTPVYMSPEQAESKEVDQRSDIYSLGVILYEMVTGTVPFKGDTPSEIAGKHSLEAPRNPKELVPQLPDSLNHLILKCLDKNKEKRYQGAQELRQELGEIAIGETTAELPLRQPGPPVPTGPTRLAAEFKRKKTAFLGAIAVILALAVAGLLMFRGKEGPLDSIAVLPFENVNSDPETDYLCDGITETLINKLSQLSVFKKVISRASSFAFKGETVDLRRVGQELGVKTVLTARMVRHGEIISISPALVKTSDNSQLWGERYERKPQDILAIEEEITSAIITALRLKLTGEEEKSLSERPIGDVRAYEFYLKAKREIRLWTKEGCDRALQHLEKGLEIIGENAMLNAGIGYVYYSYANLGIRAEESGKKAESFANKALELDPESTEAHFVLGLINSAFFGNQQKAVYHLKRALAANPYDGDILWWLGLTYIITGKISAAEKIADRMSEFDPLNPQTGPAKINVHHYAGRLDLAFEILSKNPPLDPPGLFDYAWFLVHKKRLKEAEDVIEKNIEDPKTNLMWQLYLLLKYAARGDRENFSRWLSPELLFTVKRDPQYSSWMADFYARLGDKEKALDWLENAVGRGFINYPYLRDYDPYLENIRGEPRFKKLLERVKHDWEHFEE